MMPRPSVIISQRNPADAISSTSYIWVRPFDEKWNDFGYRSVANIIAFTNGQPSYEYRGKVAVFDEQTKKYEGVWKALENSNNRSVVFDEHSLTQFFSLAESLDTYRYLVQQMGPADATQFLKSTHDLVAIAGDPEFRKADRAFRSSEAFRYSITRTSEAYHALQNAGRILRGLQFEEVDNGPKSIQIPINDHVGGDTPIDFTFDHERSIPKRTCVIIGKNGVGKSTALGNIARKGLKGIGRGKYSDENRILTSRILAFTAGSEHARTFPRENLRNATTWYKRFDTARSRKNLSQTSATKLIVDLRHYSARIARKSRYDIFLEAASAINNADQIALTTLDPKRVIYLHELRGAGEQKQLDALSQINTRVEPVRESKEGRFQLSTGEIHMLKFLATACLNIENGALLLIDEPETHLHPNFIAELMSALENLLSNTGSCAVVATHSAHVVREVFHDQVFIIESDANGKLHVKLPAMKTFGASVSSISSFVFGEDGPSFLAKDTLRRLRNEFQTFEDAYDRYGEFLSRELLSSLREAFTE